MRKFKLINHTCHALSRNGRIVAGVDDKHEAGAYTTWLEMTIYRGKNEEYLLSSDLYIFQFEEKLQEYSGCVSFGSAWELYDYLRAEGRGLEDLVDSLMDQAAENDPAFLPVVEQVRNEHGLLEPVFQPATASAV